jgi:hypothetical protein
MKKIKLFYFLAALACVCFVTCENPIMKTWWEPAEVEYVPIVKMVPQVTYETVYETVIEYQTVHDVIIQQLPPEVIHDTIVETETIYETIIEKVPEYVYETVIEYETVYETIIEKVPEYIYETIIEYETVTEYETIYETIYETVYETITVPPTDEQIKEYIINNREEVIQIIKDDPDFEEFIKEYIKNHIKEVIKIIKDDPDYKEIIREIIREIPPDELITYLTDEQIKYIIQQQPPQIILQTIEIIDIEYIIFAGSADKYNGPHGAGASTDLTVQEKNSNDASVSAIAKALKDNPEYLIILHGHANPTAFTAGEIGDLMTLSLNRAKAVEAELEKQFKAINGGTGIDSTRVSVSGYGGEKNLYGQNSAYTALNRRVEMILVRVGVEK